jgi:pyridoxal phosphate enzyme (YggS family)
MSEPAEALASVRRRIERAAAGRSVTLVAVGKAQPAEALRALAGAGQRAFGETYVQEALAKRRALAELALEWHFIGPLQSNKCRDVARHFDWLQSLDRGKLVAPLARGRAPGAAPLNVLVQVNVDDESSKSGCRPEEVPGLARAVAGAPGLSLRGLMAVPAPYPDLERRRAAFRRMRALFDGLRERHASVDTLSLGMSDDFELAIEEGASMVRVGSALFGPRPAK